MTLTVYNNLIERVKKYPIGTGVAVINTKKGNLDIIQTLVRDIKNCGVDVTNVETTDFKQIRDLESAEEYLKTKGTFGTPIGYAIILLVSKDNIYTKLVYNNLE